MIGQEELRALLKEARSLGIDPQDERWAGKPADLEEEVKRRRILLNPTYEDQLDVYKLRRLKLGAAYIAGASLNQLAYYEDVTVSSVRQRVHRAGIPKEMLAQIGTSRVGKGMLITHTQVTAMMEHFDAHKQEYAGKNVLIVAAKMREAAMGAADPMDSEPARVED